MFTFNKLQSKFSYLGLLVSILLFVLAVPGLAQTGDGGTKSLFTDFGAGARALGLGQAYVALADDPSAVFWNPAGLDFVQKKSVSFFYSDVGFGTAYNFVGLAIPTISIGSFGFGWIRIATDDIERRDDATGFLEGVGTWSQNQFLFSYSKQLTNFVGIGATLKLENYNLLSNISDTGIGGDIGAMYRPDFDSSVLRDLSFGINVQNIWTPKVTLEDEDQKSPFNFKVGILKPVVFGEERNTLNFLFDANFPDGAPTSFHFGTEFTFRDAADLRVGYNGGQIALGAGASYRNFHFDYNFGKMHDSPGDFASHRFSITIEIGKTKHELIRLAEERRELEIQVRRDEELWKQHELDFHNNIEEGRDNFYEEKDYLSAFVQFNAAKEAAEQLVDVSMRLRGDSFDDPDANDKVVTANSLLEEAVRLRELADTRSDSVRSARIKEAAKESAQEEIARELQDFILDHREKGNEFFKNGFFTNAIREWQLVVDRTEASDLQNIEWVSEVKSQVQKNIENARKELEGNVQETINRANRLVQRGQYRQALDLLYQLRSSGLSESEGQAVDTKINSLQQQLTFDQNFTEGVRYYEGKQWKEAAEAFDRALKSKPRHTKAKEYYDNAYARSIATQQQMPQGLRVKFFRGAQLYREGKYKEALSVWEECRQEQPFNKEILSAIDRAKEKLQQQN